MSDENQPLDPSEIDGAAAFRQGQEATQIDPTGWNPPKPEDLNSLFPDFEITALLGRGGMGAVYKAIQVNLDREVAIKLLPPEMAAVDPTFGERFQREAKAMAKLDHPNIVTVFDFGVTSMGHSFFVMEFVDGMDFHQLIHSGQLDLGGALNAVSQICDALEYAHAHGLVHRDIKPANIFINQQGILKVGDFGLAKIAGSANTTAGAGLPTLTIAGSAMGTPFYSAPEQLDGGEVDQRADIYSLGVMFYEMLTREIPRGHVSPPSEKVPNVDKRLDDVVFRAMESEPDARYPTVSEMRTEVDAVRTGQGGDPPPPPPPPPPPSPNLKFFWIMLLIATLAGGAWWASQNQKAGSADATAPPSVAEPGLFPLKPTYAPGELVVVGLPNSENKTKWASEIESKFQDVVYANLDIDNTLRLVRDNESAWMMMGDGLEFRSQNVHRYTRRAFLTSFGKLLVGGEKTPLSQQKEGYLDIHNHHVGIFAVGSSGKVEAIRLEDSETHSVIFQVPEFTEEVIQVSCGNDHAIALLANGRIKVWGSDFVGRVSQTPRDLPQIISIGAVANSSIAISKDGRVWAWGGGLNPSSEERRAFRDRLSKIYDAEEVFVNLGSHLAFLRRSSNRWVVLSYLKSEWEFLDEVADKLEGCHFMTANRETAVGLRIPKFKSLTSKASDPEEVLTKPETPSPFPLKHTHRPGRPVVTLLDTATELEKVHQFPEDVVKVQQVSLHAVFPWAEAVLTGGIRADLNAKSGNFAVSGDSIKVHSMHNSYATAMLTRGGQFLLLDRKEKWPTPPDASERFIQVAPGSEFFHLLTPEGKIRFYGKENKLHAGVQNVPTQGGFTKISSGDRHALALTQDGTVVPIGGSVGKGLTHYCVQIPKQLPPVIDIAACRDTSWAIDQNGKVHAWGYGPELRKQFQEIVERIPPAEALFSSSTAHGELAIRHPDNWWTIFKLPGARSGEGSFPISCPKAALAFRGCEFVDLDGEVAVGILPEGEEKRGSSPIFESAFDHEPGRPVVAWLDPESGRSPELFPEQFSSIQQLSVSAVNPVAFLVSTAGEMTPWDPDKRQSAEWAAYDSDLRISWIENSFANGALTLDGAFIPDNKGRHATWAPQPASTDRFSQISPGNQFFLFLRKDGGVHYLGDKIKESAIAPKFPTETGFVEVSAGNHHGLALRANGEVIGIGGYHANGMIHPSAKVSIDLPKIRDIGCMSATSWAVTKEGRVRVWGLQLSVRMKAEVLIDQLEDVERIFGACAGKGVIALRHAGNRWSVFRLVNDEELVPLPKAAAALEGCGFAAMNDEIIVGILPPGAEIPAQIKQPLEQLATPKGQ